MPPCRSLWEFVCSAHPGEGVVAVFMSTQNWHVGPEVGSLCRLRHHQYRWPVFFLHLVSSGFLTVPRWMGLMGVLLWFLSFSGYRAPHGAPVTASDFADFTLCELPVIFLSLSRLFLFLFLFSPC